MKDSANGSDSHNDLKSKRVNVYFNTLEDFAYVEAAANRHSVTVPKYLVNLALAVPLPDTTDAQLTNRLANIAAVLTVAAEASDPERQRSKVQDALNRLQAILSDRVAKKSEPVRGESAI